ncbi:MAG: DUF3006 domain-containing protein [Clostridia bacterium]|nr:DUF3006 domain-containing protein [Clostridia bacterium]MBQ7121026.1 DUF3006 domain-containing protein [Clostridia bacterium]
MFYSIDRLEEEVAVCIGDDEEILLLSVDQIIGSYCEGSIIRENDEGYYTVDEEEEIKRRSENFELAESLFDE